ncbi:MAG: hypothetical protein ACYDCG_14115 [Candidatus Acidiferrales bacterium]
MSEQAVDISIATLFLIVGSIILTNIDALTRFDQSSGLKMHSWFKKKLGTESIWNRKLYSVGTPSGHKKSKVAFTTVGILCLLAGFVSLSLSLMRYLR